MANKRKNMVVQQEIKRLKELGHSKKKVAQLLGINRETVRKYWDVTYDPILAEIPAWVNQLDWNYIDDEIEDKVPKKILYEELSTNFDLPTYQSFCHYIRKYKTTAPSSEITIKIERNPGDSIEVDYSGDSLSIINPATGEIIPVELFVGVLSYSSYFYAEFTYSQKLEDFINSHVNMFNYFGGSARYIIPDNCKTAVIKSDKHDPQINSTYLDMCRHYKIAVDPADGYKPRHKPNVEKTVDIIQKDFFPRVRNKTYTSLYELNQDLRAWLTTKNKEMMKNRGKSRIEFFEIEKHQLRQLPTESYELFYFKTAKVHPDCHIQHNRNYYSVPWTCVGKEVTLKYNQKIIYIFSELDQVAMHSIYLGHGHHVTNKNHYPEKKIADINYHLETAKGQAKKIGPHMETLISKLINVEKYPLKIIRKIQAIMGLRKKFSADQLEYAANLALEFNKLTYQQIVSFAKNYKKLEKEKTENAPIREYNLICLQGGKSNANGIVIK